MDKATPTRRKRTQRDYTMGFKLAVVEQVEKGHMTYKQAQRHFGIQGRSTVLVSLRKHGSLECSALMSVSRQGIYQHEARRRQQQAVLEPVLAMVMVMEVRRYLPRIGTRKLYHLLKPRLQEAEITLGRDGLFDSLRQHHQLIQPRRCYTKTTFSKHWMKKYPNLLKDRVVTGSEQVFVSNITYLESDEGVHYVSLASLKPVKFFRTGQIQVQKLRVAINRTTFTP